MALRPGVMVAAVLLGTIEWHTRPNNRRNRSYLVGLVGGSDSSYDYNPNWNIQADREEFLKDNPYVIPRPWVAGHGRKDWRGKSPEYSDSDLVDIEDVQLPDESTRLIQQFPIPDCAALCLMREKAAFEPDDPDNTTHKKLMETFESVQYNEIYWNDSWTFKDLRKQLKKMERRIKKPYNLTPEHLCQIVNNRAVDPRLLVTIAPHLRNLTIPELLVLGKHVNETLPR
ncbi:hypothetical protein AAMO2058_001597500 [Amorphochlora amoebiformis]